MKKNKNNFCPILYALDIIGGKWKIPIIGRLKEGTKRFKELERSIGSITPRMLVKELKDLEQSKIVSRQVFAEVPPRVEYTLTESGLRLQPIIDEIIKWGQEEHKRKGEIF